jgi:hypothetical protein
MRFPPAAGRAPATADGCIRLGVEARASARAGARRRAGSSHFSQKNSSRASVGVPSRSGAHLLNAPELVGSLTRLRRRCSTSGPSNTNTTASSLRKTPWRLRPVRRSANGGPSAMISSARARDPGRSLATTANLSLTCLGSSYRADLATTERRSLRGERWALSRGGWAAFQPKRTAGGTVAPPAVDCFSVATSEGPSAQTRMCSPVAVRVPGTSAVAPSPLSTMLV